MNIPEDQKAVLRVSLLTSELLEAVTLLSEHDRNALLQADFSKVTADFSDEERNAMTMCTAAVAAHIRINPRIRD